MSGKTKIEWTDATWNPTVGCSLESPGCTNCYAMKMAWRLANNPKTPHYRGTVKKVNGKAVWTGDIHESPDFDAPLSWRKPRRIFVNSMSDLFHESLKVSTAATVFAIAVAGHLINGHTCQILTKRSGRLKELMLSAAFWDQVNAEVEMHVMEDSDPLARRADDLRATLEEYGPHNPPPGIWLGVSVEDRKRRFRIEDLQWTPARVRILSIEPLLEDLGTLDLDGIHQVIVGGESGSGARPMHPDWARSLRDQCVAAGVPFFFKQWGEWLPGEGNRGQFDPTPMHAYRRCDNHSYDWPNLHSRDVQNFGTHEDRWSGDLTTRRVGKKAAGRLLDGRTWDEFPAHGVREVSP